MKGIGKRLENYYLTEHWRDVRQQRLEIDNFECRLCGNKEDLEVHHKPDAYNRLGHEDVESDLTTLCCECHDVVTDTLRRRRYEKKQITPEPYQNSIINKEKANELAEIKVPAYRSSSPYHAQRATS